MSIKGIIAAVAAAGLMVTPALAAGSDAAASARATQVSPSSETVNGDQQIYGASILLQLGIVIVAAGGIYLLLKALKGKDKPASP